MPSHISHRTIVTSSSSSTPVEKSKKSKKQQQKPTVVTNIAALLVPQQQLQQKQQAAQSFSRYLYVKRHSGALLKKQQEFSNPFAAQILENGTEASGEQQLKDARAKRTVFVANLPPVVATEVARRDPAALATGLFPFISQDSIESIHMTDMRSKSDPSRQLDHLLSNPFEPYAHESLAYGPCCHLVLDSEEDADSIMNGTYALQSTEEATAQSDGLLAPKSLAQRKQALAAALVIRDLDSHKKKINKFMKKYDKQVEREEQLIDALRSKPDEDGWVKVVAPRGKRHLGSTPMNEQQLIERRQHIEESMNTVSGLRRMKALEKGATAAGQEKKQTAASADAPMPDLYLYRFQRVEAQKQKYSLLREKFENDKQKIERMKQLRMFKPQ